LLDGWIAFPNTSSLVFRKSVFRALGGFDTDLPSCQDHDLWMRVGLNAIAVRYVAEGLYVVGDDARDRISTDYPKRMAGVRRFLDKWRSHLLSRGPRHFREFMQQYLVTAAFDVFASKLRARQFSSAATIYCDNFVVNPFFYRRLTGRLTMLVLRPLFAGRGRGRAGSRTPTE